MTWEYPGAAAVTYKYANDFIKWRYEHKKPDYRKVSKDVLSGLRQLEALCTPEELEQVRAMEGYRLWVAHAESNPAG